MEDDVEQEVNRSFHNATDSQKVAIRRVMSNINTDNGEPSFPAEGDYTE